MYIYYGLGTYVVLSGAGSYIVIYVYIVDMLFIYVNIFKLL